MAIRYHYCTLEIFEQIIKNNTLRLSDIRKSNDFYEMELFYKQYEGLGEISDCINKYNETDDGFWKKTEVLIKGLSNITECFAICFSDGEEKLSQWERYANKGNGLAIGFDEEKLKKWVDDINNIIEKKVAVTNYVKLMCKKIEYKKIKKVYCPGDCIEIYDKLHNYKYIEECAFTKHKGFHEEKEFRIALLFNEGNTGFLENDKFNTKHVKSVSLDESKSTRYLDLKFPKDIIKTVYLGPIFSGDEDYIKKFLKDQQYNCKVVRSEIPYIPKGYINTML